MLKSERGRIAKAVDGEVDGAVDAVAARGKQEAHSRLQKYFNCKITAIKRYSYHQIIKCTV